MSRDAIPLGSAPVGEASKKFVKPTAKPWDGDPATDPRKEQERRTRMLAAVRAKLTAYPSFKHNEFSKALALTPNVLADFAERNVAPSIDVLRNLVDLLDPTMWLNDAGNLAPVSSRPADRKAYTPVRVATAAIKELDVPAADKNRQPATSPNLSREEATVLWNILYRCDAPVPIRAIRDSIRQGLNWEGTDDDYRLRRLDTLTQIMRDNQVIFPAPDQERPNVGLVRIAAPGLAWVRRFV